MDSAWQYAHPGSLVSFMIILVKLRRIFTNWVEILKTCTVNNNRPTPCLIISFTGTSSSFLIHKKCIVRFFFLVLLSPFHIFFNQQRFDILPVEIIRISGIQTCQEVIDDSGKLPSTTVANILEEISSFICHNCSAREVI